MLSRPFFACATVAPGIATTCVLLTLTHHAARDDPEWIARACIIGNDAIMNPEDIMRRLEILRIEHRDLDMALGALVQSGATDQLQVARLKKRKLRLRDEIAALEDALIPDIIA